VLVTPDYSPAAYAVSLGERKDRTKAPERVVRV
jgi:hypothetical protein